MSIDPILSLRRPNVGDDRTKVIVSYTINLGHAAKTPMMLAHASAYSHHEGTVRVMIWLVDFVNERWPALAARCVDAVTSGALCSKYA